MSREYAKVFLTCILPGFICGVWSISRPRAQLSHLTDYSASKTLLYIWSFLLVGVASAAFERALNLGPGVKGISIEGFLPGFESPFLAEAV